MRSREEIVKEMKECSRAMGRANEDIRRYERYLEDTKSRYARYFDEYSSLAEELEEQVR